MGVHEAHWVRQKTEKKLGKVRARLKRKRIYRRMRNLGENVRTSLRIRDWSNAHIRLRIDAMMAAREEII